MSNSVVKVKTFYKFDPLSTNSEISEIPIPNLPSSFNVSRFDIAASLVRTGFGNHLNPLAKVYECVAEILRLQTRVSFGGSKGLNLKTSAMKEHDFRNSGFMGAMGEAVTDLYLNQADFRWRSFFPYSGSGKAPDFVYVKEDKEILVEAKGSRTSIARSKLKQAGNQIFPHIRRYDGGLGSFLYLPIAGKSYLKLAITQGVKDSFSPDPEDRGNPLEIFRSHWKMLNRLMGREDITYSGEIEIEGGIEFSQEVEELESRIEIAGRQWVLGKRFKLYKGMSIRVVVLKEVYDWGQNLFRTSDRRQIFEPKIFDFIDKINKEIRTGRDILSDRRWKHMTPFADGSIVIFEDDQKEKAVIGNPNKLNYKKAG